MNRLDIVVDIETLGLGATNPIIQIGAVAFDLGSGTTIDTFKMGAKVNNEAIINGDTLRWWFEVNPDLLKSIICEANTSEDLMVLRFVDWLGEWRQKVGFDQLFLWGNGILFDNKILKEKIESYNLVYPIYYRNDRDVRTIVDLYCSKYDTTLGELKAKFPPIVAHDGLEDAIAEAKMVSYCYNGLVNGRDKVDPNLDDKFKIGDKVTCKFKRYDGDVEYRDGVIIGREVNHCVLWLVDFGDGFDGHSGSVVTSHDKSTCWFMESDEMKLKEEKNEI